jgi:Zn-dependent M16 (insulinase) family peptidase
MNAFTASDWTMYPFLTPNSKDFANLMDVYLDAVFFPLLSELSFKQEGWRLEKQGGRLVFKGVVYNEMKGALSSPNQIMAHALMEALYPDVTYGNNSGGDPRFIPDLTHENLVAFHRRHYHPSNAFFYTYGDLDPRPHLEKMSRVLESFERIDPNTVVPLQPRFAQPVSKSVPYPISPEEDLDKKSQAALGWLVAPIEDCRKVLAFTLLERVLLANAGSPLRKALTDSALGSTLADSTGFEGDLRDTLFAAGLKGVSKESAPAVWELVEKTLADLAREGLDQKLVLTAADQYEFARKEISNAHFGWGLKLFMGFCSPWFHGADPVRFLDFEKDLAELKKASSQGYFEMLIKEHLLENPHSVRLLLYPDPDLDARREEEESKRLELVSQNLSDSQKAKIDADAKALEELQEARELVSVLPTLAVNDITREIERVEAFSGIDPTGRTRCFVAPTNGILYATAAFLFPQMEEDLALLAPFFAYALTRTGTRKKDFVTLAREIATNTGGMGASCTAMTAHGKEAAPCSWIALDVKCLEKKSEAALSLFEEIVFDTDFSDLSRLGQLVSEYAALLESRVVANGHHYAMSLCSRGFSPVHALGEAWSGIHQVRFARQLALEYKGEKLQELSDRLKLMSGFVFAKSRIAPGLSGGQAAVEKAANFMEKMSAALGEQSPGALQKPLNLGLPQREGWTTSTSVSFCAYAKQTVRLSDPDAPALAVAAKLLRSLYLHREIREKGGAYGGFALYSAQGGLFSMASYRDPHVSRTIEAFAGALDFAVSGDYENQDVAEAILQVASEIDKPDSPSDAARKAFVRSLIGLEDEVRQGFKDDLLALTPAKVRAACERHLQAQRPLSPVCVISGSQILEKENKKLNPLLVINSIN